MSKIQTSLGTSILLHYVAVNKTQFDNICLVNMKKLKSIKCSNINNSFGKY